MSATTESHEIPLPARSDDDLEVGKLAGIDCGKGLPALVRLAIILARVGATLEGLDQQGDYGDDNEIEIRKASDAVRKCAVQVWGLAQRQLTDPTVMPLYA